MNDPKRADDQTSKDEQLESLPDQQVSADDAESVKGGIVVQGGLTPLYSSTTIKIDSTISSTTIQPLDTSLTQYKY